VDPPITDPAMLVLVLVVVDVVTDYITTTEESKSSSSSSSSSSLQGALIRRPGTKARVPLSLKRELNQQRVESVDTLHKPESFALHFLVASADELRVLIFWNPRRLFGHDV
jgi:hypothetical protein